jgi:hypothetical protein
VYFFMYIQFAKKKFRESSSFYSFLNMNKSTFLKAINDFPNDLNFDELLEKTVLIDKIDEAEKGIHNGETIDHDDLKKIVATWKKQFGSNLC